MILSKLAVGIPIILWTVSLPKLRSKRTPPPPVVLDVKKDSESDIDISSIAEDIGVTSITEIPVVEEEEDIEQGEPPQRIPFSRSSTKVDPPPNKPAHALFHSSILPALLVGSAMVSRGEIGLLIAQIAKESAGGLLTDDTYLMCIWAILICMLVGPMAVGFIVTRWGPRINQGIWS